MSEDFSGFTVARALEMHKSDSDRFKWFAFVFSDWGGFLLEKLSEEANLTWYKSGNVHGFADSIYEDPPSESEIGYFLDGLSELGVASKKDLINPIYDLSFIVSDSIFSKDVDYLAASIDEAEKQISRIEKRNETSEYLDESDSLF